MNQRLPIKAPRRRRAPQRRRAVSPQNFQPRRRATNFKWGKLILFVIAAPFAVWAYQDAEAELESSVKEPMAKIISNMAVSEEEQSYLLSHFERVHPICYSDHQRPGGRRRAPSLDERSYIKSVFARLGQIAQEDGRGNLAVRLSVNSERLVYLLEQYRAKD